MYTYSIGIGMSERAVTILQQPDVIVSMRCSGSASVSDARALASDVTLHRVLLPRMCPLDHIHESMTGNHKERFQATSGCSISKTPISVQDRVNVLNRTLHVQWMSPRGMWFYRPRCLFGDTTQVPSNLPVFTSRKKASVKWQIRPCYFLLLQRLEKSRNPSD